MSAGGAGAAAGAAAARRTVREGEWVVALHASNAGAELVLAAADGVQSVFGTDVFTRGLVGLPLGACLDLRAPPPEPWARAPFQHGFRRVYRIGDKGVVDNSKAGAGAGGARRPPPSRRERKRVRREDGGEEGEGGESEDDKSSSDDAPNGERVSSRAVGAAAAAGATPAAAAAGEVRFFEVEVVASDSVGVARPSADELRATRDGLLERLGEIEVAMGLRAQGELELASQWQLREANSTSRNDLRGNLTTNQKLSTKEIEAMAKGGMAADAMIERLAENNLSFEDMTAFAKKKYKDKKVAKYAQRFRIVPANAATIGTCFWDYEEGASYRLGFLRPMDTMPQLLGHADVRSGARVLVLDSVWGYLVGSVLERLGEAGRIWLGYLNQHEPVPLLDFFNPTPQQREMVMRVDIEALVGGFPGDEAEQILENKEAAAQAQLAITRRRQARAADALARGEPGVQDRARRLAAAEDSLAKSLAATQERLAQRRPDMAPRAEQFDLLRNHGADSLIVASKYDVESTILALLPFLKLGGTFAAFSETPEPLARLREALQESCTRLRLFETTYAEHQVLPGRTHPMMMTCGRGGFILAGIKIQKSAVAKRVIKMSAWNRMRDEARAAKDAGAVKTSQ
jgi:tRNA (adenine-N(1)-)-methyltransferase non-catalytic subunit